MSTGPKMLLITALSMKALGGRGSNVHVNAVQ
jgi:hypothetical protein